MIIDDPSCEDLQRDLHALPPPPNPERSELLTSILTRYIDADAEDSEGAPDASTATPDAGGCPANRRRWFVVDPLNVAWLERSMAGYRSDLWFDLGEVPDSVGLPGLIRAISIDANPHDFEDLYARIERYVDTQLAYAEHDRGGWNRFPGIPFAEHLKRISETTWDLWLEREDDAVYLRQEVTNCAKSSQTRRTASARHSSNARTISASPPIPRTSGGC